MRKIVQDIWKLQPASNTLCYTTYQIDFNRPNYYSDVRRMGRYYTVTLEQLFREINTIIWWMMKQEYKLLNIRRINAHQKSIRNKSWMKCIIAVQKRNSVLWCQVSLLVSSKSWEHRVAISLLPEVASTFVCTKVQLAPQEKISYLVNSDKMKPWNNEVKI